MYDKDLPDTFYNSYMSVACNSSSKGELVAPKGTGACLINFALEPGLLQPSGHINVSRAREFYLSI